MKRTIHEVIDRVAIADGESIEFTGLAPLTARILAIGDCGVYLGYAEGTEEVLIGSGSGAFTVDLPTIGHTFQLRFESSLGLAMSAFFSRQHETLYRSEESSSFLVVKPRIRESEEMRQMRVLLLQQRQAIEARLTAERKFLIAEASKYRTPQQKAIQDAIPPVGSVEAVESASGSPEPDDAVIDPDAGSDPTP